MSFRVALRQCVSVYWACLCDLKASICLFTLGFNKRACSSPRHRAADRILWIKMSADHAAFLEAVSSRNKMWRALSRSRGGGESWGELVPPVWVMKKVGECTSTRSHAKDGCSTVTRNSTLSPVRQGNFAGVHYDTVNTPCQVHIQLSNGSCLTGLYGERMDTCKPTGAASRTIYAVYGCRGDRPPCNTDVPDWHPPPSIPFQPTLRCEAFRTDQNRPVKHSGRFDRRDPTLYSIPSKKVLLL